MIQLLAKNESDRICSAALLETDRKYFEMGARIEKLSHGLLAWMPGLTNLAASCVVHRVGEIAVGFDKWMDEVEQAVAERNVPLVRIYIDTCTEQMRAAFLQRGYRDRAEIGFLAPPDRCERPEGITIREVVGEHDWQVKHSIHAEAMHGPDGYTNQAELWVQMERRKCITGGMRSFLVEWDGEICGTVGAIAHRQLLRLKNIVILPRYRRRGLGVSTVQLLKVMAGEIPGRRLGVYGVDGGPGSRLYQRAGLQEINCQIEWSRLLNH